MFYKARNIPGLGPGQPTRSASHPSWWSSPPPTTTASSVSPGLESEALSTMLPPVGGESDYNTTGVQIEDGINIETGEDSTISPHSKEDMVVGTRPQPQGDDSMTHPIEDPSTMPRPFWKELLRRPFLKNLVQVFRQAPLNHVRTLYSQAPHWGILGGRLVVPGVSVPSPVVGGQR